MSKKLNKRKYSLILLVGVLALMGVGYAYLSTTVNFNGTASINSTQWNIYLDNIQVRDGSVTPTTAAVINDAKTEVTYGVTLVNPGDFYEFTVDIKNDGSIDGMIENISSKLNNAEITTLPDYLEYEVSYSSGVDILPNHFLKASTQETYKVRIRFKRNVTAEQLPTENQTLNLSFSVTYKQADENGVEIPSLFSASLMSLSASDTVITDDGTADHNMRYTGKNPNNYVTFAGEEWRVIGVFNNVEDEEDNSETRVKIIRSTSLESRMWNNSYLNLWSNRLQKSYSSLNLYLQNTVYSQNDMIESSKWYLGDPGGLYSYTASRAYMYERGLKVAEGNDLTWTGKVALMYPSDYGFASSACNNGSKDLRSYNDTTCINTNWMYIDRSEWLLSPTATTWAAARYINENGYVDGYGNIGVVAVNGSLNFRPVVYLKAGVSCTNCSDSDVGSQSNPFQIA